MRFDTPVYFQSIIPGRYNYVTGDYGSDTVLEALRYSDITDAREETIRLLYRELRQGVLILRLQSNYNDTFESIRIGDKVYRVDFSRKLRQKHIFYVTEVP